MWVYGCTKSATDTKQEQEAIQVKEEGIKETNIKSKLIYILMLGM